MILAIFGVVVLVVAVYFITIYNSLINVKNNIPKAWSNIDVLLKQRHDELPKLIQTCETYMAYEKATLTKVIELRSSAMSATSVEAKVKAESALSATLGKLFALSENYPDLKAQSSFQQLQSRISGLENQIADRREFYNESVNNYNIRIESLPDRFVASFMGLQSQPMFKVSDKEKEDVEIKINTPV